MVDIYLVCIYRILHVMWRSSVTRVRVEAVEAADQRLEARGCWGPVSASVKCGSSAADLIWVTIVVLS